MLESIEVERKFQEMGENTKSDISNLGQKIDELTQKKEIVNGKCQTSEIRSA